jgi:uncharacterized protein
MELSLIILILFICFYEPIIGNLSFQRFKKNLDSQPNLRVRYYGEVMAALWAPTLFILILVFFTSLTLQDIGLSGLSFNTTTLGKPISYFVLALYALYIGMYLYHGIAMKLSNAYREKVKKAQREQLRQNSTFTALLPASQKEKRVWTYVSLTAGITEEIIYRGFLIFTLFYFFPNLSIWVVLILSSFLFGLAHTYQGVGGVLKTAIIGLIFAMLYVIMGSIIPLMIIHFLIDFVAKSHSDEDDRVVK